MSITEPHTGILSIQFIEDKYALDFISHEEYIQAMRERDDYQIGSDICAKTCDGKEYYTKWLPWTTRKEIDFSAPVVKGYDTSLTIHERRVVVAYVNAKDCMVGDSLYAHGFMHDINGYFKRVGDLWVRL